MNRKALDELKQQILLLDYLQAHDWQPARQLSRGRLMGLCPLHADHQPSFLVDPRKSLFYCYGCGRGGDVIRFAELYHQVKFPQALSLLHQWHGLPPLLREATAFYRMQLHRHSEAVAYPFHPLHGATLQILRRPKRGDAAVCVIDPTGRRLKIPAWMLSRDSAEIQIGERPQLSKGALLSLAPLIASQLDSKDHVHDNLLQTAVDGCKGGRRGAITISGPDDPKERLGRATGRRDTRRSDRSHGPRSGGGLSRGGRKS